MIVASVTAAPALPVSAQAPGVIATRAGKVVGRLMGAEVRQLPFEASHVALYWKGSPDALVTAAFSRDGVHFGPAVDAGRDEAADEGANATTYGAVLAAGEAKFVRVKTNVALPRLTVLGLADRVRGLVDKLFPTKPAPAPAGPPRPAIVSRAAWGADESLRFDKTGKERWTPKFAPIQKLIVHHTAGSNNDSNPASTIRAIYYYHAVTRGWGDIGYNFLVDQAGRIYKGRDSHTAQSADDTITGEDGSGNGVTGAHAHGYNTGAVGVALLGTLTNQDATPAAKNALEDLLAWKAYADGIDPHGATRYTNSVSGEQKTFANIAGHRDVGTTSCPGGSFYATLPAVRDAVAARMRAGRAAA
ncbi:MAG: hypothetical protein QOJ00_3015 [Actinomycetota bacterium]